MPGSMLDFGVDLGLEAHKAAVIAAEGARQIAMQGWAVNLPADSVTAAAAARAADVAYHSAVLASCLANGIDPSAAQEALRNLGAL